MHSNFLEADEAERIAAELAAKYGLDALDYVETRAEQAQSVGDELAYAAWQTVRDATETLLGRKRWAAQ
jgi:hypothetical protein